MKLSKVESRKDMLIKAIEQLQGHKECIYDDAYKCVKNLGANFNIVVIGGIHGDEPAGICAALELFAKEYPASQMLTIIPCANPTGYTRNTRENGKGEDINRQFDDDRLQAEERVLRDIVGQADVLITLHEDDVHDGCYVYAPKTHANIGKGTLNAMSKHVPAFAGDIVFNDPSNKGLITNFDKENPKHVRSVEGFGKKMGVPSFCLEVPKDQGFNARVSALRDGALHIIRIFQ